MKQKTLFSEIELHMKHEAITLAWLAQGSALLPLAQCECQSPSSHEFRKEFARVSARLCPGLDLNLLALRSTR